MKFVHADIAYLLSGTDRINFSYKGPVTRVPHKTTYEERMPFFGIRLNAIHVRVILWMDVHHSVMCVVCTCYFSLLSTSFVSDTLKVIRSSYLCGSRVTGPFTRVSHRPTHAKRLPFFGIRWYPSKMHNGLILNWLDAHRFFIIKRHSFLMRWPCGTRVTVP